MLLPCPGLDLRLGFAVILPHPLIGHTPVENDDLALN